MQWPFDFVAFVTILTSVAFVAWLTACAVQPDSRPRRLSRVTLALSLVAILTCVGGHIYQLTLLHICGPEPELIESHTGIEFYRYPPSLGGKEYGYRVALAVFIGAVASALVHGVIGALRSVRDAVFSTL